MTETTPGKICIKCNAWKPLVKFAMHGTLKGIRRNYCRECGAAARKGHERACVTCGEVFVSKIKPNKNHPVLYCSLECRYRDLSDKMTGVTQGGGKEKRTCIICENEFLEWPSNIRTTCSPQCNRIRRSRVQSGEKSHFWKGGKSTQVELFRKSIPYKDWRNKVFKRDNYTCQICKLRGGRLDAHHIKLLSKYPSLALHVGNGITLCRECHRSIGMHEAEYESAFFAVTGGL